MFEKQSALSAHRVVSCATTLVHSRAFHDKYRTKVISLQRISNNNNNNNFDFQQKETQNIPTQ